MSYILEGLKKLEEKRRQEITSNRFIFQGGSEPTPRRRPLWPYILCAVLLLNAAGVFWLVTRGPRTEKPQAAQSDVISTVAPRIAPEPLSETTAEKPPAPPKTTDIRPIPVGPERQDSIPKPEARRASTLAVAPERMAVTKTPQSAVPVRAGVKPTDQAKATVLNDLPLEVSKALPALKMSVHYYSTDPQSRLVKVNDRTLHEGQSLSEGLKVEEINAGGAVFSFQGHRFQVGIYENR